MRQQRIGYAAQRIGYVNACNRLAPPSSHPGSVATQKGLTAIYEGVPDSVSTVFWQGTADLLGAMMTVVSAPIETVTTALSSSTLFLLPIYPAKDPGWVCLEAPFVKWKMPNQAVPLLGLRIDRGRYIPLLPIFFVFLSSCR